MGECLANRLHTLRVDHMLCTAETIRDWPETQERLDQAIIYIREAMYLCTVDRITHAEESQVFSILSFAMPTHAAVENEPIPDCVLDEAAANEAAYNEQLERRSCSDGGDGMLSLSRCWCPYRACDGVAPIKDLLNPQVAQKRLRSYWACDVKGLCTPTLPQSLLERKYDRND